MPVAVVVARRVGIMHLMVVGAAFGVAANLCFALTGSAAGMFAGQALMGGVWGIFAGLPEEFDAGRYHSLAATSVPDELEVSATCLEGEVMGVRHRELPVDGVQFHPESVLTPVGPALAKNFLEASA
jgi:GMP synthase-like glutamine amidotransferase